MTFLYFVLDVCFYNFTSIKTDFLLQIFFERKENKFFYYGSLIFIDWLLLANGKFFLLYVLLSILNKKIKLSYQDIQFLFLRFFLLYVFYKIGIFLLFQQFIFDWLGFIFNLLLLFLLHKKF